MECQIDIGVGDLKTMNSMFESKMQTWKSRDHKILPLERRIHLCENKFGFFTSKFNWSNSISNFRHVHDRAHRKRDTVKCFNQREVTRKRDRETGLSTIDYSLVNVKKLTIDDAAKVTVLNIKLNCDRDITPWCDCSNPKK